MFPAPQPQSAAAAPQAPPQSAGGRGIFEMQNPGAPDKKAILAQYGQAIQKVAEATKELMTIQAAIDPEGQALLVPIGQAGKALEARVQEISQRMEAGPGSPGMSQTASAESPAQNPSEGPVPAAMAA